jgi:hypothetical protein
MLPPAKRARPSYHCSLMEINESQLLRGVPIGPRDPSEAFAWADDVTQRIFADPRLRDNYMKNMTAGIRLETFYSGMKVFEMATEMLEGAWRRSAGHGTDDSGIGFVPIYSVDNNTSCQRIALAWKVGKVETFGVATNLCNQLPRILYFRTHLQKIPSTSCAPLCKQP